MSKKPIHEVRMGRIKAAIWENETENGNRYNVTITRLYKNGDDEWKDSTSFGRDDLPLGREGVSHDPPLDLLASPRWRGP